MATKSSIHIKPCRVTSSGAHNRRTAEYMRNIGKSQIYIVPELTAGNEQWINPGFGNPDLQAHYDYIKRMVKEKTGRAMQEKERERKGKNGKITKVAGCSPIREGVLLIRPDTTLADVCKFGEECQRRWGITPLQIFLHKDEGHWLNGQPEAEDRESFKVGERWFKPNYHAHIVFDWMNHDTGKSCKLNDKDMTEMQNLASDILLMERGQSKAVTGKEHQERNDFIIGKQLKKLGMLIVQDQIWNRVTINRAEKKSTRYYMDEFHLLLKEEQTAAYSVEIWKRFRKWGGIPTAITQNIKDLLASREVENIFENSDFVLMLNQAQGDRAILAKQLNISPQQMKYVTHTEAGEGLIFYGNVVLPFVDHFPKDTELYRIMTTKPEEVSSL